MSILPWVDIWGGFYGSVLGIALLSLRPQSNNLQRYRLWPKFFGWIVIVALTVHVWSSQVWPQRFRLPGIFGEAVACVHTTQPLVALTFDDGPHPIYTPAIIDILDAYGAKATFFVLGRHAEQHPSVLQALAESGHEIGNHSFYHHDLNKRRPEAIREEISRTDQIIVAAGYQDEIYFRPPYGHANFSVMSALKSMQRMIVRWDIDLRDWAGTAPEAMLAKFEQRVRPGAIVLLHDSSSNQQGDLPEVRHNRENTVEVVQLLLETFVPQGYQFVTVSDLLTAGVPQPSSKTCRG